MSEATVIHTPAGIDYWRFLSAVSQLTLELKTGMNYYGKTSVLTALCNQGIFPKMRTTKQNKLIALATLVDGQASSPVVDSARATIDKVCQELGVVLTPGE